MTAGSLGGLGFLLFKKSWEQRSRTLGGIMLGKLKLTNGKKYMVTLENGNIMEGELHDLKCVGNELYSLWIDMGSQLVYVPFSETKDIKLM
jgi:hypothetical protein